MDYKGRQHMGIRVGLHCMIANEELRHHNDTDGVVLFISFLFAFAHKNSLSILLRSIRLAGPIGHFGQDPVLTYAGCRGGH